ncbi:putative PAS/PAC sensor protein [Rippkaea orientalis PCC 8801]|uniref:histidine kinase n=2 Tax=Rippkaea TaxID=2546365 RepID=B7K0C9_RIPO1|nr:putative PAS/PAC sensor protein [Rippkaea orientalis PCC 8801]
MIGKMINKTRRKFRLPSILISFLVLQLAGTVGLVLSLSWYNSRATARDLAAQLRQELIARIDQQLKSYVEIPHAINRINGSAMLTGDLQIATGTGFNQLWEQAKIYPNTNLIYCGSERDGSLVGVGREPDHIPLQLVMYNQSTNYRGQYYDLNHWGDRTILKQTGTKLYDARKRPWYQTAKQNRDATWSEIYLDFDTQLPTITASTPIYDRTGQTLIGVCATDFILPAEMSRFLRSLKVGQSGQTFIMKRSGTLVASSTPEKLFEGEGDQVRHLSAIESNSALIRGTAQYLQDRFDNLKGLEQVKQLEFTLDGERQFVQILPFQDKRGIDWLTVVVVPEKDFLAQINQNTRNTLVLSLVALAAAIAIGIITSRWVTRPILRVSQASNELAHGNLDQHLDSSFISEINTLANSFNRMAGQLKDSFETLERKNQELRLAEENYRSIFENALEGIFQSSPEGRYLKVNSAMARIYGYESPQEMLETITDISTQIYVNPTDQAQFQDQMENNDQAQNLEYQVYRKDGEIIWIQEDTRAVRNSNGELLYYEGMIEDITERKRRENELRRQLEELKIEIDQKKRQKEVAMLTESSYFQEVQEEIEKVDLDEFWS